MTGWLHAAMPHLIVVPVVLPLVTAALLLLIGESAAVEGRWST